MVLLSRPSTEVIREFLAAQSKLGFTYSAIGATNTVPPAGYDVDHTRIKLWEGQEVFTRAKVALLRWDHFRLSWVEAWSPKTTIDAGDVVAVIARMVGVWWLNACRIIYIVDEEQPIHRYGIAYGTLPQHAESGEERFLIGLMRQRRSGTTFWHSPAHTFYSTGWGIGSFGGISTNSPKSRRR
jgi:uncharacterized protein (UPF0548 family)